MFTLVQLQVNSSIAGSVFALCIWTLLGGLLWTVWIAFRQGWRNLKRLHQIPCDRCAYFTGEQCLKCAVHPTQAFTEDAIECLDYQPTTRRPGLMSSQCAATALAKSLAVADRAPWIEHGFAPLDPTDYRKPVGFRQYD